MAEMKAADIRAMSPDQMDDAVLNLKKERFNLRFQRATGQLENTSRLREARREVDLAAGVPEIGAAERACQLNDVLAELERLGPHLRLERAPGLDDRADESRPERHPPHRVRRVLMVHEEHVDLAVVPESVLDVPGLDQTRAEDRYGPVLDRPRGLEVGDILLSVDGQPADNVPTVNYNFRLRDSTEKVQLVVLRAGTQHTISVAAVEQRDDLDSVSSLADPQKNLVPELGLLGVEIDATIAARATGLRAPYGIIVVARAAGATSEVPLQARDVIRSVNKKEISTLQGLREAIRALPPGSPVTLQVQREGRLMYVSFTLD